MLREDGIKEGIEQGEFKTMLELVQERIHENHMAPEGVADEKTAAFEARYDAIVQTAAKEYEDVPPSDYYRDG